jgi:DNA invertase Pin-like site-specific DNA recombinase
VSIRIACIQRFAGAAFHFVKPTFGNEMTLRFVSYLRVSTDRQGKSGLGLEAQRDTVQRQITQAEGHLAAEFVEVESGKRNDRPQLDAALRAARAQGAVLIIAKVDRLARNARFLLSVVEGVGDAGVVFCDMPQLPPGPVGKFMLTQLAAVAELEAGLISQRTKAALAAAKARGVRLGNPNIQPGSRDMARRATQARQSYVAERAAEILPYIAAAKQAGATTLATIAEALEARGVRAPRGGTRWAPSQVARLLARAEGPTANATGNDCRINKRECVQTFAVDGDS